MPIYDEDVHSLGLKMNYGGAPSIRVFKVRRRLASDIINNS